MSHYMFSPGICARRSGQDTVGSEHDSLDPQFVESSRITLYEPSRKNRRLGERQRAI